MHIILVKFNRCITDDYNKVHKMYNYHKILNKQTI